MPYVRPIGGPKPPRRRYPSDLTDAEWALVEPLLPRRRPRGQPRVHGYRDLLDGILYVLGEGARWRALPHDLPPWPTVYAYFRDWQDDGTWQRVHDALMAADRRRAGRAEEPTGGVIDSQTVRTAGRGDRGYDGAKRLVGRKRHLVVDTEGRAMGLDVHDADLQDPDAGADLLEVTKGEHPALAKVWADARYRGGFVAFAADQLGIAVEVVTREPGARGFVVQARRWVVESTLPDCP